MRDFSKLLLGASAAALLIGSPQAFAQDEEARQTTVVVTGSFIAGTPEDAALPVDVLSAEDLQLEGNPRIDELIRRVAGGKTRKRRASPQRRRASSATRFKIL